MTKQIRKCAPSRMLLIFLLASLSLTTVADVVIIANKNVGADSITSKQAKKLWLGKLKKFAGAKVTVVDQAIGSDIYEAFYTNVVKKKPGQLKAYWAKVTFTGKGFPPKQLKNDAAVVKWVSSTSAGLGYIDSSSVNSTVKSLLITK